MAAACGVAFALIATGWLQIHQVGMLLQQELYLP